MERGQPAQLDGGQKAARSEILDEAASFGVDWVLCRLAYDERTRAPIEVHRARAWVDAFADLVALDALDRVALIRPALPARPAKR